MLTSIILRIIVCLFQLTKIKVKSLGMNKINDRYAVLPFSDYVMNNSTDPYIAIRSALHQAREASIQYPTNFKCPTIQTKY